MTWEGIFERFFRPRSDLRVQDRWLDLPLGRRTGTSHLPHRDLSGADGHTQHSRFSGKPATIAGELRIPKPGTDRLPAVILVHGSDGVGFNSGMWVSQLNKAGFATFVTNSFRGRGITNTITDQSQLSAYTMMNDAFAALAVLVKHPRIDPNKIAVMGFSKGAVPALYASVNRFQSAYAPEGAAFPAYIGFYTPCNTSLIDDEKVGAKPIRLLSRHCRRLGADRPMP
jgi:cephalosporin-C deacetylase-like acetyl esterase